MGHKPKGLLPEVAFRHTGGFVIKTKSKDLEKAWRLIEGAYQGK